MMEAVEKAKNAKVEFVVVGARGQRITPTTLRSLWYYHCRKAGVKPIPMYAMRHLAASLALEAGGVLTGVASQLGHSTPKTTE